MLQWVVIELGHNDGGSLSDDDGRTDCPGQGDEVCYSVYDGVNVSFLFLFLDKRSNVPEKTLF